MIGTSTDSRPSVIKSFLRADSPEGLVRLQLKVNVMLMGQASYTDVQFVNGYWYAWFLVDIDRYPEVLKINGPISNTRRPRAS